MRTMLPGIAIVFCLGTVPADGETLPPDAQTRQAAVSLDELRSIVKIGDTIRIVEKSGKETTGRIDALSPTSLRLRLNDVQREFIERDILQVERRKRDPVRNGLLIGVAAGAIAGFVIGNRVHEGPCPPSVECGQGMAIGTVGGAFWGGVAGWLGDVFTRKREVIYRAP